MGNLKFRISEEVTYIGDKEELSGRRGKITATRLFKKSQTDIAQRQILLPKKGFDYTITFLKSGGIKFILDVKEADISK